MVGCPPHAWHGGSVRSGQPADAVALPVGRVDTRPVGAEALVPLDVLVVAHLPGGLLLVMTSPYPG